MVEIKILDLFSGIGGFTVAHQLTERFKTVAFCEKNKFCQKVLAQRCPNPPIF